MRTAKEQGTQLHKEDCTPHVSEADGRCAPRRTTIEVICAITQRNCLGRKVCHCNADSAVQAECGSALARVGNYRSPV